MIHVVMLGVPYIVTYPDEYLMGPPQFTPVEIFWTKERLQELARLDQILGEEKR